jgi:hypothetical protein
MPDTMPIIASPGRAKGEKKTLWGLACTDGSLDMQLASCTRKG